MSDEYILSITSTFKGHFNTYISTHCEDDKEDSREN